MPIAPEAGFGGKYLPGAPPAMPGMPLGGPPPEVLVSPEHMAAYAANCRRTLHYAVNGTLLAKRDHIQHQIGRLRARMLEVAHVKGVMEREIQSEASEALQRLESSESLKMMRIQREVDELARHADAINTLASEVDAVTSAPDAHTAEFLGRYRVSPRAPMKPRRNRQFPQTRSPPSPSQPLTATRTSPSIRSIRTRRLCTTRAIDSRVAHCPSPRTWTRRTLSARLGCTPPR